MGASATLRFVPAAPPAGAAIERLARRESGLEARIVRSVELLRAAAAEHPGRIVQATSLGVEDMVVTELIARHRLPIAVATLDTGRLHAQTLALVGAIERRHGLRVEVHRGDAGAIAAFDAEHGALAMRQSVELRKHCCRLRKLVPLATMLQGRSAWVTGLRRGQSEARADVPEREQDADGRLKANPLAAWSEADVWQFVADHQVPYNALHDGFMPSIGCEPCTRAITPGEDVRAGRWWWEDASARECGLHVHGAAAPIPNPSPNSSDLQEARA